jgi:ADP-ribose pyrophosphatase
LSRRSVFRGRLLDVTVERARLPNGVEADFEVVRHRGAAAIVPVTADNEVVLVRQYRFAVGDWLLEVPAGTLATDEAPEACAHRELAEEVGLAAQRLEPLGSIWTTPGFTDERIWLFLATGLAAAEQRLDPDEVLSVVRLPLAQALAMAAGGEIVDGKSVAALLRAAARLGVRLGR